MNFSDIINRYLNIKPKEPTPVVEPVVVSTTNTDSNVCLNEFDVMIIDGIDKNYVKKALMLIPNIVHFNIIAEDWTKLEIDPNETAWKNFVYPKKTVDNMIVIFNGRKPGREFRYGGGACILDENYHRIGISTAGVENDPYQMALRIWHEIQHVLDRFEISSTEDADDLYVNKNFYNTMPPEVQQRIRCDDANNPIYLLLYNFYLTSVTLKRAIDNGGKT